MEHLLYINAGLQVTTNRLAGEKADHDMYLYDIRFNIKDGSTIIHTRVLTSEPFANGRVIESAVKMELASKTYHTPYVEAALKNVLVNLFPKNTVLPPDAPNLLTHNLARDINLLTIEGVVRWQNRIQKFLLSLGLITEGLENNLWDIITLWERNYVKEYQREFCADPVALLRSAILMEDKISIYQRTIDWGWLAVHLIRGHQLWMVTALSVTQQNKMVALIHDYSTKLAHYQLQNAEYDNNAVSNWLFRVLTGHTTRPFARRAFPLHKLLQDAEWDYHEALTQMDFHLGRLANSQVQLTMFSRNDLKRCFEFTLRPFIKEATSRQLRDELFYYILNGDLTVGIIEQIAKEIANETNN